MTEKSYRWFLFKHWANLTFLGAALVFALVSGSWFLFIVAGVLEVCALWILPDVPLVKRRLDLGDKENRLEEQRWYFLRVLWGVQRPLSMPLDFLIRKDTNWSQVAASYHEEDDRQTFRRLSQIVTGLRSFRRVQPDSITEAQLARMDEVINGWLNLLYMAKNADESLSRLNKGALEEEFNRLKEMYEAAGTDKNTRVVLGERLRTLKDKVTSIPRLEQRRDLARAQADTLVHHIETIDSQVRSAGSIGANVLMDTTMESLVDIGTDEIASVAEVRGMLTGTDVDDSRAWDEVEAQLKAMRPETDKRLRRKSA